MTLFILSSLVNLIVKNFEKNLLKIHFFFLRKDKSYLLDDFPL